jgi:aminoglycoside phosphotransferase family enzyme/predicted kinase
VIPEGQRPVAALLRELTGAEPVETHISAVFVGRDDAYKLKKAVRLPFVDQSTPARRESLARRELELNRPLAPAIYRDVLPVTLGPGGAPRLGGEGAAVDWVLRLAPVPEGDFLDAVAARGALGPGLLDALADTVTAMLAEAPVAEGVDPVARMATVLEGNLTGCRETGLDPARLAVVEAGMRARLAALAPAMAERARHGFVRRCHGDLHLGNLCLWEGRPVPFDALEFDEALARIDTGYDLAFLLMDLEAKAGRPAANRLMSRVLARSFDIGLLAPMPFWLAQRALVRAKLEPARGRDGMPYLEAAERFLAPAPPRLVAVGGLQGTGKTRLARSIAPGLGAAPGALHLRTDEIRKRRAGIGFEARLPPSAYAEAESLAVHAEMFGAARQALVGGHSVVLDAVFLAPAHRAAAEAVAREAGVPFAGFWLQAPLDLLRARVAARQGDASDATEAVLLRAAAVDPGPVSWQILDAAGDPAAAAIAALALQRESGA